MLKKLNIHAKSRCAVIVAHPDDETLWAGGFLLMHPEAQWTILTLCRKHDPDRAPKFVKVCDVYGAQGAMADLDDGPDQQPLANQTVQDTLMQALPSDHYDLVVTHGLWGEYTRHLRHEEVSRAVMALRRNRSLHAPQVLHFAYDDNDRKYLPQADTGADILIDLAQEIWDKKYTIITDIYGFTPDSWEARTTPKREAFWEFGG